MKQTLVIGVGSILCGDDGVGIRAVEKLEEETLPENVVVQAGDLSGLDLLKFFPDFDKVIIIDAAAMKEDPGTIKIFKANEIKKSDFNDKFSTHGMALLETLTLAEQLNIGSDITIVGIQPEDTGFNLELSSTIANKLPEIVNTVKKVIGA